MGVLGINTTLLFSWKTKFCYFKDDEEDDDGKDASEESEFAEDSEFEDDSD